MATIVDTLYNDIKELGLFLESKEEVSLMSFSDSNLRKNLLLASASFYENSIQEIIANFSQIKSANCNALIAFVKSKGIKRQYHTYFNWDSSNANSFLGLFGPDFKDSFTAKINADEELKNSIKAFIEVGRERNRLVHQNFGNFILEKTAEEIYSLHEKAQLFVSILNDELTNAT